MQEFGYRKLVVWQEARKLVGLVYTLTREFPKEEMFGLTSQARRAAVSIVANVAEGWLRKSIADKRHFIEISQGSLMELDAEMDIAREVNYIDRNEHTTFAEQVHRVNYLLDRYYASIHS